jgi:hypothetical protein
MAVWWFYAWTSSTCPINDEESPLDAALRQTQMEARRVCHGSFFIYLLFSYLTVGKAERAFEWYSCQMYGD